MKNIRKFFPSAIVLILIGIFFIWQGIYLANNSKGEERIFIIKKGEGLLQIADNLEKEKLIKSKFFFDLYVALGSNQKKLQAGFYSLSPSLSVKRIARKIISGDIAKVSVTIPEGFTQKQIEERLGLKLPGDDLEGYLFPDTYLFFLDITGEEISKMMKENFNEKTSGLKITPEVIIMASLIEKEVMTKEDKELVSGVLWKRLGVGMPLQVDSAPETYQRRGLPFSPIANPGLESIIAAIHPKESPYWYYLSTEDGMTIFSKTLEEHNIAKARYLKP